MKARIKQFFAYIARGWEDEPNPPHPMMKVLLPFVYEIMGLLMGLTVLYELVHYVFRKF